MNKAQEFNASLGFIIFFLIGALAFAMIFGEKVTIVYLTLVFVGMVLVNQQKVSELLKGVSAP